MRIGNNTLIQRYYCSTIGTSIRNKVTGRIWPERSEQVKLLPERARYFISEILEPDKFSAIRGLKDASETRPMQTLFISDGIKVPISETFSNVKKLANGFKQIGIKANDKVALMGFPYERELLESFFALQAIGAVPVLINYLNPSQTITFQFACSDAKTLIVGRDSRLRTVANKLVLSSMLERVITIGDVEYKRPATPGSLSTKFNNLLLSSGLLNRLFYKYEDLIKSPEISENKIIINSEKNAPAVQLYTSGSSKRPKRMTYSHETLASHVETAVERSQAEKGKPYILSVPFYHLAGLLTLLTSIKNNSPLAITDIPRASEPDTIHAVVMCLVENKISRFSAVPKILEPVLEEALKKGYKLDSLSIIGSSGAPMTPKLINLVNEINKTRDKTLPPIVTINTYGSTECGPISCTTEPMTPETTDCLGLPFKNVEVKISEKDGQELLVRVKTFPPEISEGNFTEDGYFKTGDGVRIGENGLLYYTDRLAETLNVYGEKISPLTIQREVEKVPGIKEVHIFGIPKLEDKTDIVCAVVVPKDGYNLDKKNIWRALRGNIEPHLKSFIPTVIFIEPKGIPDTFLRGGGKTPRTVFKQVYGERAIKEYKEGEYKK